MFVTYKYSRFQKTSNSSVNKNFTQYNDANSLNLPIRSILETAFLLFFYKQSYQTGQLIALTVNLNLCHASL